MTRSTDHDTVVGNILAELPIRYHKLVAECFISRALQIYEHAQNREKSEC